MVNRFPLAVKEGVLIVNCKWLIFNGYLKERSQSGDWLFFVRGLMGEERPLINKKTTYNVGFSFSSVEQVSNLKKLRRFLILAIMNQQHFYFVKPVLQQLDVFLSKTTCFLRLEKNILHHLLQSHYLQRSRYM